MSYNLFFKGLSADKKELEDVQKMAVENGFDLDIAFDDYGNITLDSLEKLSQKINERATDVNFICHSMGCNLGILTAKKIERIRSLVLISPEFGDYSDEELEIQAKAQKDASSQVRREFTEDVVHAFKFFKYTQPLAAMAVEKINVPILIIFSKGDIFIPQEYLRELSARKDNIELVFLDTNLHNPLLDEEYSQKTMKLVKKHIL